MLGEGNCKDEPFFLSEDVNVNLLLLCSLCVGGILVRQEH